MEERFSRLGLDDKISNELWARAISNLEGVFPKDINFSFDKLSILLDLKKEVEEARSKCDEKRLSYTRKNGEKIFLRDVLGKIIKWVNIFKETGDMAVQYDPGHAALPWALVRFLLQVAVADVEKYEFLVDNLEDVSRYMARCKILERLYVGNGELGEVFKASLVGLYGQLLLYLAKAKAYFAKRKIVRVLVSAFHDKSEFEVAMDKISKAFEDVNKSTALIRREEDCARYSEVKSILEAQGATMKEMGAQIEGISAPIQQMRVQMQNVQDNLDSMKRRQILNWMSDTEKLPYLKHHKENKRQILKGTGQWLLNDEIYTTWKYGTESSLLWLHGIPGSGKSKLTSLVIEDGLESCKQGTSLRPAFFYCSRNTAEPARSDAGSILASIARQLANLSPSTALLPPVVEKFNEEEDQGNASGSLDIDDAKDLIIALVALYPITVIIIDALDECPREGRAILIEFIKNVIQDSSSLVKFFISSREDGDIVFHLGEFPSLKISSGKNQVDIEAFVKAETGRLVNSGSLLRHSQKKPLLMDEIISRVARDAQGMFRWASLQLQSLTELKTDADILLRLGKVPPSLEQLYLEIYQIIITNHGPVSQTIAHHSFDLLLGAKDDFTVEMFLAFVTPDKANPISVPELLDICCNLIVLDETSKIIRFAHTSVLEFFESLPEFSPTKLHSGISFACLELVDRWNSSGRDVWSWNLNPMGRYVNKYLRYHLREAGSQERLGILLPQLVSFLGRDHRKNFITLDDRSRKFWRVIRSAPEHVEHTVVWVFNACAFGFHEIVDFAIQSSLVSSPKNSIAKERSTYDSHRFSATTYPAGTPVTFNRSHIKNALTPATFTCLALHALRYQSYTVLAMLIERHLCLLSDDLFLQPTCMCAHALGEGPVYHLLHFYGLAHVNEGLIRLVIDDSRDMRGDGEYDLGADAPPLVVQDLISGGLQFHITKDMLDKISPPSSNKWTYESWFLLLENDSKSEISSSFIKTMVRLYPNDKRRLQTLFRICQRNGISQDVFEELASYCRYVHILDWMREADSSLSITEMFLINVLVDNESIHDALFERWKFIEERMNQDVLTSLIYTTNNPTTVKSVLQQYPHLQITWTVLNALFERWTVFYKDNVLTPPMLEYFESREDFQESKKKLVDPESKLRVHQPLIMASWFQEMLETIDFAREQKENEAREMEIQRAYSARFKGGYEDDEDDEDIWRTS